VIINPQNYSYLSTGATALVAPVLVLRYY